jgi:5'-nucleotidase
VVDYDGAARIGRRIIDQLVTKYFEPGMLLNVNVPDLSKGPPMGVKVVAQSMKGWREGWERRSDPRGRTYYWMIGDKEREDAGVDSDVAALAERYVTVTPLRIDLTDHVRLDEVRGLDLGLDA